MKKALFICSRIPYPAYSGAQIRMMNNLRALSERYDVDVLCYSNGGISQEALAGIRQYAKDVIYFKVSPISFFLNVLRGIFINRKPIQVNLYYFRAIARWVRESAPRYSLVFCMHIRTAEYALPLEGVRKAIDYVDAISKNYENAANAEKGIKGVMYALERRRVLAYEILVSNAFHKCVITTENDRDYLAGRGAGYMEVVPHFTDDALMKAPSNAGAVSDSPFIMFLGKMDYEPNVNAVTRFCDGPFQKIKKELPDLKFLIVGARPSVSVKELEKIPGVSVTGFVESVLPYVQQAILVVAPMVSGSGIQTKVLEAMRHGKCVVATAKGADGLDNLRGGELRIVDEYSSLAEAVIELVNDGVMRMEIENRAKEYYASRYSFDIAKSRMLAYLEA